MKNILPILGSVLVSAMLSQAASIEVQLDRPPAAGTVIFKLFDSADAFGDFRDPIQTVSFPLDGREVYRLSDLPEGEYALLVYYDENENGTLDKNFIGIPREPLAFSNSYQPKGPPQYPRAAFNLAGDETVAFDMALRRPLGERGRLGLGAGVIAQSLPYRGSHGGSVQFIPALTYTGERLQLLGPSLQVGLLGSGNLRLAAVAQYRFEAYEEADSPMLEGLGDSESTLMSGLALQVDGPAGIDASLDYRHDVLGRIQGGEASFSLSRGVQWGAVRLSPRVGLNWLSREMTRNDFGVPAAQSRADRPAYHPGSALNATVGLGAFMEVASDWLLVVGGDVEWLDDEITDSVLVDENTLFKGLFFITRIF